MLEGVAPAGPAPTPEKTEVPDAEHAAAADERTKDEPDETLDKVTDFVDEAGGGRARPFTAARRIIW